MPLTAVRTDKPAPYVQVVEDGKVVHKPVQTGARGEVDDETWVARERRAAGATVIAGSVGPLREGTAVQLHAARSPPPARARQRASAQAPLSRATPCGSPASA